MNQRTDEPMLCYYSIGLGGTLSALFIVTILVVPILQNFDSPTPVVHAAVSETVNANVRFDQNLPGMAVR
jgi:hypothetical protein